MFPLRFALGFGLGLAIGFGLSVPIGLGAGFAIGLGLGVGVGAVSGARFARRRERGRRPRSPGARALPPTERDRRSA